MSCTVSQYSTTCFLIAVKQEVNVEFAIKRVLYGLLWGFGNHAVKRLNHPAPLPGGLFY